MSDYGEAGRKKLDKLYRELRGGSRGRTDVPRRPDLVERQYERLRGEDYKLVTAPEDQDMWEAEDRTTAAPDTYEQGEEGYEEAYTYISPNELFPDIFLEHNVTSGTMYSASINESSRVSSYKFVLVGPLLSDATRDEVLARVGSLYVKWQRGSNVSKYSPVPVQEFLDFHLLVAIDSFGAQFANAGQKNMSPVTAGNVYKFYRYYQGNSVWPGSWEE